MNPVKQTVAPVAPFGCCNLTFFFRFERQTSALEEHMRNHLASGRRAYTALSAGASEGREALSAVVLWRELTMERDSAPPIRIIAVEPDSASIAAFESNRFRLSAFDREIDRLKGVSSRWSDPADTVPALKGNLLAMPTVEFPEDMRRSIRYENRRLEELGRQELLALSGGSGFNAILYHVVERYLVDRDRVRDELQQSLAPEGLFSYIS